jgi:hypothetical protein
VLTFAVDSITQKESKTAPLLDFLNDAVSKEEDDLKVESSESRILDLLRRHFTRPNNPIG